MSLRQVMKRIYNLFFGALHLIFHFICACMVHFKMSLCIPNCYFTSLYFQLELEVYVSNLAEEPLISQLKLLSGMSLDLMPLFCTSLNYKCGYRKGKTYNFIPQHTMSLSENILLLIIKSC